MKKIVLGLLVSTAFATPALAADFSGPRIEGRVGWDRINLSADYDDGIDDVEGEGHEDGVAFGVEAGFDLAAGPAFVVGGYAGIDFASTKFCAEVYGEDEGCIKAGRNITVGIRAGVPVGEAALLYAKGGYSNGRIKLSYEDFEDILDDFSVGENRGGWHLGAGGELAFGTNTYAKLEYVYTDYNGADLDDGDVIAGADVSRHQVIGGVGFRF